MSTPHAHTNNSLTLVGRLLLASLFIPAGVSKIIQFGSSVDFVRTSGVPFAEVATGLAAGLEILAGLALVIGFQIRIAAFALAAFTLLASVLFHAYWTAAPEQYFVTQLLFYKNIAVIGGLLSLAAAGVGEWSLDAYLKQHHDKHQDLTPDPHHPPEQTKHQAVPLPH